MEALKAATLLLAAGIDASAALVIGLAAIEATFRSLVLFIPALVHNSDQGTWSLIRRRFQRTRWTTGMPRRVIRFSTEQATLASVFWAGRIRARKLLPMMTL